MNGPRIPNLVRNFPCQSHRNETHYLHYQISSRTYPPVTDPTQPQVSPAITSMSLRTSNSLSLTDHGSELLVRQDHTDWKLRGNVKLQRHDVRT